MRISNESQRVCLAQAEVAVVLCRLQAEQNLTNIEMLQAINMWQGTTLKYMLRAERHPDDPDRAADEE